MIPSINHTPLWETPFLAGEAGEAGEVVYLQQDNSSPRFSNPGEVGEEMAKTSPETDPLGRKRGGVKSLKNMNLPSLPSLPR